MLVAVVFAVCLLPATTHRTPGVLGYLWCAIVLMGGAGVLVGRWGRDDARSSHAVSVSVAAAPFVIVLTWAGVTLLWSAAPSRLLALMVLLLAGASVALPALAVVGVPESLTAPTLCAAAAAAVLATAGNGLVYSIRLGERLAAPLGPGSAVHLPLTLAMAVLLGAALAGRGRARWVWIILAVVAAALTLRADSRAGTWALVLLAWLVVIRVIRSHRVALAASLTATVVTLGLLGYLRAQRPDVGLVDGSRWDNHVHGLRAWADGGWSLVAGRGSGSVWPWLSIELGQERPRPGTFLFPSPWGDLLYHPHSTLLGVLVELGPLSLLLVLLTLGTVMLCAVRVLLDPDPARWVPAAALLTTAPGLLFETYLFRGFLAALVWWTVALCIVRWGARTSPHAR